MPSQIITRSVIICMIFPLFGNHRRTNMFFFSCPSETQSHTGPRADVLLRILQELSDNRRLMQWAWCGRNPDNAPRRRIPHWQCHFHGHYIQLYDNNVALRALRFTGIENNNNMGRRGGVVMWWEWVLAWIDKKCKLAFRCAGFDGPCTRTWPNYQQEIMISFW